MRYVILCLLLICSELFGQMYPYEINTIRYILDIESGSDITEKLSSTISMSEDGDVIVLPRGRFLISRELSLGDKMVSIIGRGIDEETGTILERNTNVEDDFTNFFLFLTSESEVSFLICISGIYFKSLPSIRYSGVDEVSLLDVCLSFYNTKRFIISDNVFQYFGSSGIIVKHSDSITSFNGLIYNNNFLDIYRPEIGNFGYGVEVSAYTAANKRWISMPEFGSEKFLFVEDNYFRETRHAIAGGSNGKYVFRMNTIEDNWKSAAIDMHGSGNYGNIFSTRATEIYGNEIINEFNLNGNPLEPSTTWDLYPAYAIQIRGGESLIYNNSVTNYRSLSLFQIETQNPATYPSPYQIGYLSGLQFGPNDSSFFEGGGDGDVFIWNNEYDHKFTAWSKYFIPVSDTFYLKDYRDIHFEGEKLGYTSYVYPHDYRKLFYSFIDTFLNEIAICKSEKIGDNTIKLVWNNVLCEDGYYIKKSTDGINFSTIDSTNMNDTSLIITDLETKNYWFSVCAHNDHHKGINSNSFRIDSDLLSVPEILVYPNPSNGIVNIEVIDENDVLSSSYLNIFISNMDGRVILEEYIKMPDNKTLRLLLPGRSEGFYLISILIDEVIHSEIISVL